MSHVPKIVDRRAPSFGADARDYAEHSPGYPTAAIDWALLRSPRSGQERRTPSSTSGRVRDSSQRGCCAPGTT